MAATAVAVLELCDRIVNFVNPWLLSDLAVCADLAMATVRCADLQRPRQPAATSPTRPSGSGSRPTTFELLSRAGVLIQQVSPRIWARHAQGA